MIMVSPGRLVTELRQEQRSEIYTLILHFITNNYFICLSQAYCQPTYIVKDYMKILADKRNSFTIFKQGLGWVS